MKNNSLKDLYILLEKMETSDYKTSEINIVKKLISKKESLLEDSSAGGPASSSLGGNGVSLSNASISGMGAVTSAQPSSTPGALTANWASGGGTLGSGDISVPYNPSGKNRMFQKIPIPNGMRRKKQGDPNIITKKYRNKPIDMKSIKNMFSKKGEKSNVMNFNDFANKDFSTKVTKIKEGSAFLANQQKYKKEIWDRDKIATFQEKVEGHVIGLGAKIKQVGNDYEIYYGGKHIIQVMFRPDYVGVKKQDDKFASEFKYDQLGKIKSKLTEYIKSATKIS